MKKIKKHEYKLEKKNCLDCGIEIFATPKQTLCDSCRSIRRKKCYKEIERDVVCWKCGEFLYKEIGKGTKTKKIKASNRLCKNCGGQLLDSKKIERNVVCRECGEILYKETIRNGPHINMNIPGKLCSFCKEKHQYENKKKNIEVLNNYRKFIKEHPENKKQINSETLQRMSHRMKENNPMKDPSVAKKMGDTLKKKYKNGEIKKRIGRNNWNFKGNRLFNPSCRKELYKPWIYPILERDKFHCTKCNSNKNLQVHHIRHLRDIIELILKRNNIINVDDLLNTDRDLFENLVLQVVEEHKLEDGITVCKNCHIDIDERYRVKKI